MENTNTFDDDDDDDDLHLLPQDVLIQILVLLPVISLLRFKSVCKSWCALIQTSFFIDLHRNKNNNTSNFGTFIFQTGQPGVYDFYEKKYEAFMLSSGGGGCGDDDEFEKLKWEGLGFPPCYQVHKESPGKRTLMVGSCNGLICIHDTTRREVSLWNPATRQFRLLPKSSSSLLTRSIPGDLDLDLEEDFAAFGYDVETKDYKVVQISWSRPYYCMNDNSWIPIQEYIFRVQVYTSSTDSWRLLEGINSFPGLPNKGLGTNHGVYLNGSYYFQTGYAGCKMILSFDFTKEIFTTIQLHEYHLSNTILTTYLGEKLAVFARVIDESYQLDQYDIWVLNEHGGGSGNGNGLKEEESWTKIHSIQLNDSCTNGIPRGISNDGEFAFIDTNRSIRIDGEAVPIYSLQLINLVTKEVVKEEFRCDHLLIRADVYKQSLVSICGN